MKVLLPIIVVMAMFVGVGDMIHACVENSTGNIRIVETDTVCNADETALKWGIVGIQGDPGVTPEELSAIVARIEYLESQNPLVAKTLHRGCYSGRGTEINCYGTGQDGEYQYGSTPGVRAKSGLNFGNYDRNSIGDAAVGFTDNDDGTVTDNLTGLVWLKDANCFDQISWLPALNAANGLGGGRCNLSDDSRSGDWRLPNINELRSLFNHNIPSPYLPTNHPFSNVQANRYWSSTSNYPGRSNAWIVNPGNGNVIDADKDEIDYKYHVWPVRDKQ